MNKKEIEAMRDFYAAKSRALFWYQQAKKETKSEEILRFLVYWQYAADEANDYWKKIKQENHVRLTLISIGHPT